MRLQIGASFAVVKPPPSNPQVQPFKIFVTGLELRAETAAVVGSARRTRLNQVICKQVDSCLRRLVLAGRKYTSALEAVRKPPPKPSRSQQASTPCDQVPTSLLPASSSECSCKSCVATPVSQELWRCSAFAEEILGLLLST